MVARYVLTAAACLAIALAVTAFRPVSTAGPFARDFEAYWSAGVTSNHHADPYGKAIWSSERAVPGVDAGRDELLPFIGPPHTLLLWRLAGLLPYGTAAAMWWCVLALSLLALVAAVLRAGGSAITPLHLLMAVSFAIAFAPISSDLALGQVALPAFLGAVLVMLVSGRSVWLGAAAASLAFAQPNAAFGLAAQIGRNRVTLAIVLGLALTYVLGSLIAGWSWPLSYAHAVAEHGQAERFSAIQFGPAAIAFGLGATQDVAIRVALVVALLALVGAIALARKVAEPFARFAGLSAIVPFVAGFFHEHDFIVAVAAALWCAIRTSGATRAIGLAGTLLVGFDWLGLAQRPGGLVQSVLLEAALLASFIALGERLELRRALPIAATLAALVAVAAVLALRNPLPVWPDLLAGFHAPASASVAAVWLDEQRANGLLAPVAAWALLRSLSLLGCALLAYAIYRRPSCYRTA